MNGRQKVGSFLASHLSQKNACNRCVLVLSCGDSKGTGGPDVKKQMVMPVDN